MGTKTTSTNRGAGKPYAASVPDGELERAFERLLVYDWGHDPAGLAAIDHALAISRDGPEGSSALENRLARVLSEDAPRAAKEFVCRRLSRFGSRRVVPAIAALLTDGGLSHMARYALERMPCEEATAALRDSLEKTTGRHRIGVIHSLGARRDRTSAPRLAALLRDEDLEVRAAAVRSLGAIGTAEAASALGGLLRDAPPSLRRSVRDAVLGCAEVLFAAGEAKTAVRLAKGLDAETEPPYVRDAARRFLARAVAGD